MLPRLMMLPLPRAAIFGASAATRKYGARTLAANSRSKVAASRSAVGPNQENPALLTRTSTGPACSARWSSWPRSLRSAAMKRALPPPAVMASTTAAPRAESRPCTRTSAPCRASASADARPMPEVAPVTRALMPSRSRCSFICDPFGGVPPPWTAPGPAGYPTRDCTCGTARAQSWRKPSGGRDGGPARCRGQVLLVRAGGEDHDGAGDGGDQGGGDGDHRGRGPLEEARAGGGAGQHGGDRAEPAVRL